MYAFYFDSSVCSGCKACQAACKDKHGLEVGRLWRRVYEVTGGEWTRAGAAWVSTVFAYNLSLSCNHCGRPICVEVCPARAIARRHDGIVLLDADTCLGCKYCSWACPYGAPQYDAKSGHMTKCTFCADNIDAGMPPACVAACPMRALDFGTLADLEAKHGTLRAAYPMPQTDLTDPALVITPHQAAARAPHEGARIGNREETGASHAKRHTERSLIAFTILSQTAVGALLTLIALGEQAPSLLDTALPAISAITIAGVLASFFHLGTPRNAWRAFANLRSSWLSREILCATLFTAASVLLTAAQWLRPGSDTVRDIIAGAGALIGLALIVSMANAYRLRTIPAWNTWMTPLSFFTTAALLGGLLIGMMLAIDPAAPSKIAHVSMQWIALCAVLLSSAHLLITSRSNALAQFAHAHRLIIRLRLAFTLFGIGAASVILLLREESALIGIAAMLVFGAMLTGEALGRVLFYKART